MLDRQNLMTENGATRQFDRRKLKRYSLHLRYHQRTVEHRNIVRLFSYKGVYDAIPCFISALKKQISFAKIAD